RGTGWRGAIPRTQSQHPASADDQTWIAEIKVSSLSDDAFHRPGLHFTPLTRTSPTANPQHAAGHRMLRVFVVRILSNHYRAITGALI
ncbi:MAG: hypothetical protein L0220_05125, partial [Acidobacteria bacterium]|nr:hypothetical protein [Acidobacteriota bacterium]